MDLHLCPCHGLFPHSILTCYCTVNTWFPIGIWPLSYATWPKISVQVTINSPSFSHLEGLSNQDDFCITLANRKRSIEQLVTWAADSKNPVISNWRLIFIYTYIHVCAHIYLYMKFIWNWHSSTVIMWTWTNAQSDLINLHSLRS